MRRIAAGALVGVICLILSVGVRGQGTFLWQDTVDRGGNDRAADVVADKSRVFVAGSTRRPFVGPDWFVRAYSADSGAILWTDEFDSGLGERAFVATVDGTRLFVAGFIAHPSGLHIDFAVRAYDVQTGTLLWQDRFDYMSRDDFAQAISAGGGRVVVAGGGINTFNNQDLLVRAYDARTGAVLWTSTVDYGADDEGEAVLVDKGRAFVAGIVHHTGDFNSCRMASPPFYSGNCDYWVRAYDAATGSVVWTHEFDLGTDFDGAFGVGVQGGRIVTAGIGTPAGFACQVDFGTFTGFGGNCDFLVRVYEAGTGALLWTDRVDPAGGGFDAAFGVAADSSRVFISGIAAHPGVPTCINPYRDGGNCDLIVRAYEGRDGTLIWQDQYDRAGGFDLTGGLHPAVHGNRIVISGRVQINAVIGFDYLRWQDCVVRAYDTGTGALLWMDQYDMPPNPEGHDRCGLNAAQGPRTFVVGRGTNANGNEDYLVRAYNR